MNNTAFLFDLLQFIWYHYFITMKRVSGMAKIIGREIKNIPWQNKPEGYQYPVWRYDGNPIITRDNLFFANSIFNSAVVPFGDGFAGVFRVDTRTRDQVLVTGFSDDAINWKLTDKVILRATIPVFARLTANTIFLGSSSHRTAQSSELHTQLILKIGRSLRKQAIPFQETAFFFRGKSTANTCS